MLTDGNVTPVENNEEQRSGCLLAALPDPEIPVLTLIDLGVIRWVRPTPDGVVIGIAPTYSGCPATEFIEQSVIDELEKNGFANPSVERVLSPPWTSDWLSDEGRKKLHGYGIVPPNKAAESKRALFNPDLDIACPRCESKATQKVSEFGSTPCTSSWKCQECLEPFEYFKCL